MVDMLKLVDIVRSSNKGNRSQKITEKMHSEHKQLEEEVKKEEDQ
jgi:hypothetical protein